MSLGVVPSQPQVVTTVALEIEPFEVAPEFLLCYKQIDIFGDDSILQLSQAIVLVFIPFQISNRAFLTFNLAELTGI